MRVGGFLWTSSEVARVVVAPAASEDLDQLIHSLRGLYSLIADFPPLPVNSPARPTHKPPASSNKTTMIRQAYGLLALILSGSCDAARPDVIASAVSDSAGITLISNGLDRELSSCTVGSDPTLAIGVTDGAPEYQLYRTFGARLLSDGRIVVVNQGSQELRFYDSAGTYLGAAGRGGAGPGEFSAAFTLQVAPGDTIWVGDYRPWEFEVFAPDGSWVRSLRPEPQYINTDFADVLDDGRGIMVNRAFGTKTLEGMEFQTRTVMLHNRDGSIVDTIGTFLSGNVPSPMFGSVGHLAVEGQRLVEGHGSKPEIRVYEIGETSKLSRIVRWSEEPKPVTQDHVAAERSRLTESFANLSPADRQQILEPQIREDRPVAGSFPYFSAIEIGRDGRIWVRSYRPPGVAGLAEWLVFDADGSLRCRVAIEPFEQLPEFGSDYILVMRRDSLGVERIFKHDLNVVDTRNAAPPGDGVLR